VAVAREYMKLRDLKTYSGLSVRTLRKLLRTKGLPYYRLDGVILVKRAHFDEWLEQFRVGSEPERIAKEILR